MKTFQKTTVETFTPLWVNEKYSTFSEDWIRIRNQFEYKGDTCFKCNRPFKLGETMGIAWLKEVGNKMLCQDCALEIA